MIRRASGYNSLAQRKKGRQKAAKLSSKSSSSWSLFTIQDASEDSGQSSGDSAENEEDETENRKAEVNVTRNDSLYASIAKLKHMQLTESVHNELKKVLENKNKLKRKVFIEPKQHFLGKETNPVEEKQESTNIWLVIFTFLIKKIPNSFIPRTPQELSTLSSDQRKVLTALKEDDQATLLPCFTA